MQQESTYKEAGNTKYPSQVVIVVAKDKNGKANPVTLGWTMNASSNPPMMAIAVASRHYSVECIRHSKCFTLIYPSANMHEAALFYGSKSGRDADKLAEHPISTQPAAEIDSVLFSDATANFECTLHSEITTGDHITFIGEVVASHINTESTKRLYALASGHKLGSVY